MSWAPLRCDHDRRYTNPYLSLPLPVPLGFYAFAAINRQRQVSVRQSVYLLMPISCDAASLYTVGLEGFQGNLTHLSCEWALLKRLSVGQRSFGDRTVVMQKS